MGVYPPVLAAVVGSLAPLARPPPRGDLRWVLATIPRSVLTRKFCLMRTLYLGVFLVVTEFGGILADTLFGGLFLHWFALSLGTSPLTPSGSCCHMDPPTPHLLPLPSGPWDPALWPFGMGTHGLSCDCAILTWPVAFFWGGGFPFWLFFWPGDALLRCAPSVLPPLCARLADTTTNFFIFSLPLSTRRPSTRLPPAPTLFGLFPARGLRLSAKYADRIHKLCLSGYQQHKQTASTSYA